VLSPLVQEDLEVLQAKQTAETGRAHAQTLYAKRAAYIALSGNPIQDEWKEAFLRRLELKMEEKKPHNLHQTLLETLALAQWVNQTSV
jgi:hypothetical protein